MKVFCLVKRFFRIKWTKKAFQQEEAKIEIGPKRIFEMILDQWHNQCDLIDMS